MDAPWYFVHSDQVRGPVGLPELLELYGRGIVTDASPVWREGESEWRPFGTVEELALAVQQRPAKRSRLAGEEDGEHSGSPVRQELPPEAPSWLDGLAGEALMQLFYAAMLRYRPHVIEGLTEARDAFLTAFIQRVPDPDAGDPSGWQFSDDFLCDAVEDMNSREELWELMGRGNEQHVKAVIRSACELDDKFLSRLYALWATGRARKLIACKDLEGLLGLLSEDEGLIMTRDLHGRTVLHALAEAGDERLLAGVLTKLPAVASQRDAVDENLDTPLHLAARAGALRVVEQLLAAGANPSLQNRDTSEYASGNWSIKSRDLDFKVPVPSQHQTPLHIAVEQGDASIVRALLGAGAKVDVRDSSGSTPLHGALEMQDVQVVQLLLAAGADPSLANSEMGDDNTPLHHCCAKGQAALVGALLQTGKLDVNRPGPGGFTALHLAARRGSQRCVELLLAHGADVAAATAGGKTPLDLALTNKREAIAELLMGAGARTSQP